MTVSEWLKTTWTRQHQRDGFLLGLAVGIFGITFGVLSISAGLAEWQAVAMSLFMFTGASQFAAVGVIDAGGNPVSALGTALLLAARNGAYALSVGQIMPPGKGRKLLAAHLVIDESIAMAQAQPTLREAQEAFWTTGLSVFVFWNLGTLTGVLLGGIIGDPMVWGLDAAFPAAFFALLLPHLKKREKRKSALIGAAIAMVTIPVLPSGLPVVLAGFGAVVGARARTKKQGQN